MGSGKTVQHGAGEAPAWPFWRSRGCLPLPRSAMASAPYRTLEISLRPDPLTLGLASPIRFFFLSPSSLWRFFFFNCMGVTQKKACPRFVLLPCRRRCPDLAGGISGRARGHRGLCTRSWHSVTSPAGQSSCAARTAPFFICFSRCRGSQVEPSTSQMRRLWLE